MMFAYINKDEDQRNVIGNSEFKKPKVSIIIPAYNVERYISECLESIINQTLKEIEIIVVDDGSSDRTADIIEKYSNMDKRIFFIKQKNLGTSAARNKGLKIARGEYISFVDSDDWVDINFLEKHYEAVTKNDADISVGAIIRWRKNYQKYRVYYEEEIVSYALEHKVIVCNIPQCCYVVNKLYRAELIKNYLFINGKYFEDILWIPEVLKKANKLVTVPNTNYYYRVNSNSIVKKNSPKKQLDNYYAHRYIIDFFRENNLELNDKQINITKETKYFFNIPILKLKERNYVNTWLLFGFLPIFKYKDFDSHYIFKFLGIRIAKRHRTKFDYKNATEYGVTKEKRHPQLIVSLTSYPARINYAPIAINTLLQQNLKPDRLILWLANSQFLFKERDLPQELLSLRELGLEIRWCKDLKSYKKLVPALREFPNDIIVTADDDIYYQKNWLKSLYEAYLKNPKNIYCKRAVKMKIENNAICDNYKRDECFNVNYKKASFSNQLMGGSGCLFPPHSLHSDIFDTNKFLLLLPTHDDIYFWVMAILASTKIEIVGGFEEEMLMIDGSEACSLSMNNNDKGSGISPKEAFKRITKEYPILCDIIDKEYRGQN